MDQRNAFRPEQDTDAGDRENPSACHERIKQRTTAFDVHRSPVRLVCCCYA